MKDWDKLKLLKQIKQTCVNLPFAISKSAWYLTLDWIFVFSAMRFSSGVSAIVVALAFGMCLQGNKTEMVN